MKRSSVIALLSLLSLASSPSRAAADRPRLEVDPVVDPGSAGAEEMSLSSGEVVWVQHQPLLAAADIASANATSRDGGVLLQLQLSEAAGGRIARYTAQHLGQRLAFLLDGHLIQAPVIRAAIQGPGLEVGPFDPATAQRVLKLLAATR